MMNSMLKAIMSLLFLLLIVTVSGQEDYAPAKEAAHPHSSTSSYSQTKSPCSKTMDFLFTNRFADMPQMVIALDNSDLSSKSKCVLRLLAALSESRQPKLQQPHINLHSPTSHYLHAVDYYIYTLRRIVI